MTNNIIKEINVLMNNHIILFKNSMSKIRTYSVSPNMLNTILVDYYGSRVFLNKLGYISVENSNMLIVNVFDANSLPFIKKAILSSDFGLDPYISGSVIYVPIPMLTFERRSSLIKFIRIDAENIRILIRNIRRDMKLKVKNLLNNKIINADSAYNYFEDIQKITNFFIKEIDRILKKKEIELLKC